MKVISYWIFPVISAIFWLATLLGLLLYWVVTTSLAILPAMKDTDGKQQTIAYISDVGATNTMKPWFIVGSIFTTVFLDLGFFADRWLRHKGRLAPNVSVSEKVLSALCMLFAVVGTVGLCCLSGFDTYHYPQLHDIFLVCFIGGYWLSAIFICAEYQRLGKKYRQHRSLRISFWVKLAFIFAELGLVVVFGVMNFRGSYNLAAIFEWIVAFVFTFYVLSFVIDLWPAVHSTRDRRYSLRPMRTLEMDEEYHRTHAPNGLPRDTIDSERTLTGANNNGHAAPGGAGRKFMPKKNGHSEF
ncbi:Frag1/DRAM/Sfk1 family-domain-containing protein [Microdochium trichocladiopsis]|uniref:Frag1/DRAM/Sfk1 family-domain-containing protein n=1 Tax=Microdochium trichocladiopsis TaxID=1682393 RepID=A0A9P8Y6Z2_9PEZI|nr:Frag1/DRAM/Sfk1 family-domain-containing protein [Microdochium trichocladiopsis]KAH7033300.1 Frag1/DRAM/Sfk1 family-domain-containing protein [Microdochium trichocladiopsis]